MKSKVWVFGDSFQTSNYPPACKKSWVDILFENKGYEVINTALSGRSTEDIILTCIDRLPEIQTNDHVLVFLSSEMRFMVPDGIGNIVDKTPFTRYIDTDRRHKDIWREAKMNNDMRVLDIADKFNTPLGSKLKMSVWNNYAHMLLSSKNLKYKVIHGHYELRTVKSNYVKTYMKDYEYRCFKPEVTAYYTMTNTVDFASGSCLINDFFHCQIEYIIDKFGEKKLNHMKNISDENFLQAVKKIYGEEHCLFHDTWHLNETGHKIYADYAKNYDWGLDD